MTTQTQAEDTVFGLIHTAWTATGAATEDLPLEFSDVKGDTPGLKGTAAPDSTHAAAFGRVTISPIAAPQVTQGERKRYTVEAVVTVQVFTPIGDGGTLANPIIAVVMAALRAHANTADGVWFLGDMVPQKIGTFGAHFQTNINATFKYQETA